MTNPAAPPAWPSEATGEDALDNIARLAAGHPELDSHPGLFQALQQGNATRQQAGAINSFLVGLQALRSVELAKQGGYRVQLSTSEQGALSAMNIDYSAVVPTHADAVAAGSNLTAATAAVSGQVTDPAAKAKLQAQYTARMKDAFHSGDWSTFGKLEAEGQKLGILDPAQESHGWFDSPGDFLHHLTHNVATNTLGKGWNVASYIGSYAADPGNAASNAARDSVQDQLLAQKLGYDTSNPLSMAAFVAHGYAHSNTNDLADSWDKTNPGLFGWDGQQAVLQAEEYAADPGKYVQRITSSGMTPEQQHEFLSNKTFTDLVTRIQGRQATIGNTAARNAGLDPVEHPTAYAYTSAGVDIVASFLVDPTLLAFKGAQAAKVAAIGLDGAADGEKIRKIMDASNRSISASRVRRGWQSMLDDATQIREGLDAGTSEGKVQAAAAMAHARATTPTIVDMMPDLLGNKLDIATGSVVRGEPITTMEGLTDYLASKAHFLRLTRGKAALESNLMPGTLSRFGYKWIKGSLAGRLAARSMALNLDREANIARLQPSLVDAVDATTGEAKIAQNVPEGAVGDFRQGTGPMNSGTGLGEFPNALKAKSAITDGPINPADAIPEVTGGLASQARAAQTATLSAADKGELLRLSRSGASPAAQWARLKLTAQRLSSFLPRNNRIILGDADGAEKIYRFGLTFLNKGDAALYAAQFARGDEGVQKAIIDGIVEQTGHAAGLGTTEAGREFLQRLPELNLQRYGHSGNERIFDPATGEERDVALFPQQVRQEFYLPNFQNLYRASAKLGVFQNTVGRVFNSAAADTFLDYERMAMLLKPNIAYRNIIEGQGNIALRGKYLDLLRAKALAGDSLTPRKKILQKAITFTALDRVGRLFKGGLARTGDPAWSGFVKEFTEGRFADEFEPTMLGYGRQIPGSAPDPFGIEDTDHIVRQGWSAVRYKRTGFGMADAGGVLGADRYAHALGMRIGQYPDLDRALIEAVENPHEDVADIVGILKTPTVKKVVDRMTRAGVLTDAQGVSHFVTTAAEKDEALDRMARLMVADMKYLLTDQNDQFIKPLADRIFETGKAPTGKWLQEHLPDDIRPKAVLAPTYQAMPRNGVVGFVQQLLDSSGRAYKYLVEDPIKRTTSEPAFLMNYGDSRMALRGVQEDARTQILAPTLERLKDAKASMTPTEYDEAVAAAEHNATEAAARIAHDAAVRRAYNATEAMIDDPGLKTQADVVGKNFLMFSRAVNAFIRRWGGLAIENPAALRRGFLAVEGLHHSGMLYTDSNGTVSFTYPGSDLAMQAFNRLSGLVPGLGPAVTYPISGALGGQFNMLAPGFDNPARFSLSPMLNMPFHLAEALYPNHRSLFDEIDRAVNGDNAQGKPWYSELVPGAITKLTTNMDEGKDSAYAGAMRSAIMYLYASDPDGKKGIFPPTGASPADIDKFLSKLRTQVKNQMYFRAIFGEFAPSPPGIPSEESAQAGKVDGLFTRMGVQNLDDEYKMLLADTHGDVAQASAIFVARNPGRLVFTVPSTHAASSGAYLPTTPAAGKWINDHLSFIDGYKQISAYFVPQQDGPFDLDAYRAQIETGLREHYAPEDFLKQSRIVQAEQTYYAALDARKAAYDKALTGGDTKLASNINANFDAWKAQFLAANPLFAEKEAGQEQTKQTARESIADLRKLTDDTSAPADVRAVMPQLRNMLDAYSAHSQWLAEHTTSNPYAYYQLKRDEAAQYAQYLQDVAGSNATLRSIYNGVFRTAEEYDLPYLNDPTAPGS